MFYDRRGDECLFLVESGVSRLFLKFSLDVFSREVLCGKRFLEKLVRDEGPDRVFN